MFWHFYLKCPYPDTPDSNEWFQQSLMKSWSYESGVTPVQIIIKILSVSFYLNWQNDEPAKH